MLRANNDDLVAIVEKTNPFVVLCIYEFSSGKGWPIPSGSIDKELLIQKIGKKNELNKLISIDELPGNLESKVW